MANKVEKLVSILEKAAADIKDLQYFTIVASREYDTFDCHSNIKDENLAGMLYMLCKQDEGLQYVIKSVALQFDNDLSRALVHYGLDNKGN